MEGLEISVLNLSDVLINNETLFRIEAEYFRNEYLEIENKFKSSPKIGDEKAKIVCGPFGSNLLDTLYKNDGILVVRPFNLKKSKIEHDNLVYIDEIDVKNNNLKIFEKGSLLFSRVGDIKIGVLTHEKVTISPNIIAADFGDDETAKFLCVFFQTYYGYKQIERQLKISAQPTISTEIISNLKFPKVSATFKSNIAKQLNNSFELDNLSRATYNQAENVLLETIGIKEFKPSSDPINVKNFKESFLTTGRLDAEYYQKKYEEVVNYITAQNYDSLSNIVHIKKSIEPGSDAYSDEGGLPFYRVSDYNKFGLSKPDKELKENFVSDNSELIEKLKPKQGTILFSKDGSVGTAYLLRKDLDGITSGAILHLSVKDKKQIIPEYLTLALNSKLVQMQAERDAGGSIILHWRVGEIENVVVPIIDYTKQQEIAELVEESFRLKKQSENILETAKRAVEIAIEENEVVALKYINDNIS